MNTEQENLEILDLNLNERTKNDFLIYANSVIKARAIPRCEDNLKPVHRKILYTMYKDKLTSNAKTRKCATVVGKVLAYHPHGDQAAYGALVRLGQWWKLLYPLVYIQGNSGNILGDGPAASRYTECKLTYIGELMVEELNKECVDFKPNYDGTDEEPVVLPSKFPYLLCGNNSGIAVGMSSDLVSHNFTEVSAAIKYYMQHRDCTIVDLMQFIKGPDFPTGGQILNGDELLQIYTTGQGSVKMRAHYDIIKKGKQTALVFHDLPYGVEIENGIKFKIQKMVVEDGYSGFEGFDVSSISDTRCDITITLSKDANVGQYLDLIFNKTDLQSSVKINNTLIIDGKPKVLSLKGLIETWVNYRSGIIQRVAKHDYDKTNHKLTVTIGLQKCLSNIDLLVSLIRNSDNKAAAKLAIIQAFELNDEQADAILNMQLSRLSRLDIQELNDDKNKLEQEVARLKNIVENESVRFEQIAKDLDEIKKKLGKDERQTEVVFNHPNIAATIGENAKPIVKTEWQIYDREVVGNQAATSDIKDVVFAYSSEDIIGYTRQGELVPHTKILTAPNGLIGGFELTSKANKVVAVTRNGNIKVSSLDEYKWTKVEKTIKLKEGDEMIFASACGDDEYLMIFDSVDQRVLKLSVKDLTVAGKATIGVKSGLSNIDAACIVSDKDTLLFVNKEFKAKYTAVKDFTVDTRGNKGQTIAEDTIIMRKFDEGRTCLYVIPKQGKVITLDRNKISLKSKNAVGASVSTRVVKNVI